MHNQTALQNAVVTVYALPCDMSPVVDLAPCVDTAFGFFLQLAQQKEPVEESDLKDHEVSNKGAGDNPDKTYDEGRIAPTPGLQTDSHADDSNADGGKDQPKDR